MVATPHIALYDNSNHICDVSGTIAVVIKEHVFMMSVAV